MLLIVCLNHVRRYGNKPLGIDLSHLLHDKGLANIFFPIRHRNPSVLQGFHECLPISPKLITHSGSFLPVKIVVGKVIPLLFVILDDKSGLNQRIENCFSSTPDPLFPFVICNFPGLLLNTEIVLLHLCLRQNLTKSDRLTVHHCRHTIVNRILRPAHSCGCPAE